MAYCSICGWDAGAAMSHPSCEAWRLEGLNTEQIRKRRLEACGDQPIQAFRLDPAQLALAKAAGKTAGIWCGLVLAAIGLVFGLLEWLISNAAR
jgi:hypothetical protein